MPEAARTLAAGSAMILRGNGTVTTGDDPGIAVTRMWLLEVTCTIWLPAQAAGGSHPLSADEVECWPQAAGLLPRLWDFLRI